MREIQDRLFELKDEANADFQAKLAPGIDRSACLGTRLPDLRKYAKELAKSELCDEFLNELPHQYHDENILHAILLSQVKPYEKCIELLEKFIPYITNCAVCDTIRPKVFAKNREALLPKVKEWINADYEYACRLGVDILMSDYLDESFTPDLVEIPVPIVREEYYVRMMIAWYYATALAKQWDSTIHIIEENKLPVWTHNKTIQKANESFRITPQQKVYLKGLKRK